MTRAVLDPVAAVVAVDPATSPGPTPAEAVCHYHCPDCGQRCACIGDARRLPHIRCGIAAERS